MIISISGMPGSGKSTVAKILAKRLGMKRYYMGDMRREIARKKGMRIDELNKIGEDEAWTDREVDDYQRDLGKKEDNFVIEGRTSFFLIPKSFKVFLDVDPDVGARRIYEEIREKGVDERNEGGYDSPEEAREKLQERVESDRRRYKKYYGRDILDLEQYDMVIDTTDIGVEEVVSRIMNAIKK